MRIVWTEPAVEDLRELHAYIARDSEMYASGFVERIVTAAELLVQHPEVGRFVPEVNDENVRELLYQRSHNLSSRKRSDRNAFRNSRCKGYHKSQTESVGN